MNILKVTEVIRLICETNMGALKLHIRKGGTEYFFTLDSVELPKDLDKEIYELLYAPEIPQVKYLVEKFTGEDGVKASESLSKGLPISVLEKLDTGIVVDLKKKGGRPVGSKNKK